MQVNIQEAKTNLSNLIRLIETGKEESIIIARQGKPVARIVAYEDPPISKRIGVAKENLESPNNLDLYNHEVAALFDDML